MLRALLTGMNRMNESEDPTRTLEEIFDADFYPSLVFPNEDLVHILEDFYDDVFPALAQHTRQRPDAAASD